MVKLHKLHKFAGISGGVLLLLLSLSGFFLDHDKWSFLYTTTFSKVPKSIQNADKHLFNAYYFSKIDTKHIIVGGKRGIFQSYNGGDTYIKISSLACSSIKEYESLLYFATSNGIYTYNFKNLKSFSLEGKYISALSVFSNKLVAVEDKKSLHIINLETKILKTFKEIEIQKEELQEDITLSRFIRDLHYGRALFDGDISLFINDYGTLILIFLSLSGYYIYYLIKSKKNAKLSRKLIRLHANIFVILATIPLFILLITGLFLDHSKGLASFMKAVTISHSLLPPVYSSLKADIWSVDYDGDSYRIGNRYGIYKSKDLKSWHLENRGFAYKMIRKDKILYVSGMGAPNRSYNGEWSILKNTPHMFKYISLKQKEVKLPQLSDVTLYSILLSIHDGTFFASWWVWINDFAAGMLFILILTGVTRWYKKLQLKKHTLNAVN